VNRYALEPGLAREILAHARECYPEEACGIIAGSAKAGTVLHRGRNLSPTPHVAFELDPETLARQIEFEDGGLAMTAIYHSHPNGPETPSLGDIKQSSAGYPESVTIICSLADIGKPVLRAFRIVHGQAREVSLAWSHE
jgi:proteasome lid subunit RPN8/RPN11